jgi:hypothetical protein
LPLFRENSLLTYCMIYSIMSQKVMYGKQ